jgi:hypothetical protein
MLVPSPSAVIEDWRAQLERLVRERCAELERRLTAGPPPKEQEDLHLCAQRFARVRVAEMRLYKSQAVVRGRAAGHLYAELKEEIDSARDVFERDYLSRSASLPDYLHLELVGTLAHNDAGSLGEEYPGPLA